jgi:hypothetical protein
MAFKVLMFKRSFNVEKYKMVEKLIFFEKCYPLSILRNI